MAREAPSSQPAMPTRTLIYGLADGAGRLDGGVLYDVADALGLTTTQVRLVLRRMAEAGLVELEGRGQSASILLTSAGLQARVPDRAWVQMAYRADAGLDPWHREWHLAAFEIPERKRAARDALRAKILELFGAQLNGGLYLSPASWEPWLHAEADKHGVEARLTTTTATVVVHGGQRDPLRLAAMLWPVDELHRLYTEFIDKWGAHRTNDSGSTPTDRVTLALEATVDLESIMRLDPLLPPQLIAEGFAAPAARSLYRQLAGSIGDDPTFAGAYFFVALEQAIQTAVAMSAEDFRRWLLGQTIANETETDQPG